MPFTLDPDIAAMLAVGGGTEIPATPRGDALTLREVANTSVAMMASLERKTPSVSSEDFNLTLPDGATILLRWYTKAGSAPGSAVVYAHGGGMICASVGLYDRFVATYVEDTGVPFLAVDYRMAPEHPGTTLVDDTFAGVQWLIEHAEEFGVNPERIAIMGDSAGGGIAAGVAIAARDAGVPLAKQILIYPMLDDRNMQPDPHIAPFAAWTYDNNYTGWRALLGDTLGTESVSPLSAPARLQNFTGLASAFIEIGELDIFRDESIAYASRFYAAGISCELHVRPGGPHGYDRILREAPIGVGAWTDRYRIITGL
ncbi:alpha/beta hydrolase [Arthrobacter sp. NPDC092385]|uniref:alpha/beta hydrolase n=1 Tax=Arthrobacter sp. NPDC092385 TaxID=3363943 RepID=UPI00381F9090